jgi:D-glycerate 3-kinase
MDDQTDRVPGDVFWRIFLEEERLPSSYRETAEVWFKPLVQFILQPYNKQAATPASSPQIIGIHGCQGSGKSTLAALLEAWLGGIADLNVLRLSIDDFYLTKHQRRSLAESIHPLFATRGVPGTHDIALLEKILRAVIARSTEEIAIPRFDKARDDRASLEKSVVARDIDVVLLEGWCVGLPPEPEHRLEHVINDLELEQDPQAIWRREVNKALAGGYTAAFDLLTTLVVLKAPHFDTVVDWRWEQEQKLSGRQQGSSRINDALMDREGVERFVRFFQRLTAWGLEVMPDRADLCFHLDQNRQIKFKSGPWAGG